MLHIYVEISVIISMVAITLIGGSSACPSGCICRGSPAQRDTAVCYKKWPDRDKAPHFDEPITSIEFRHMLYQDVEPYLSAVKHASTVIIYPPKTPSRDNPLPEDLFYGMDKLEALTIHPTVDRLAPPGLVGAIMSLTNLKTLDFVGNTMLCDCALPDILASRNILVPSKSRMPAVKGCKQRGFPGDVYNINDFLKKCAERGGYELSAPSNANTPVNQARVSNRYFANVRDKNLFNKGVGYSRINLGAMKPKGVISSPGAFRGALGKPPSGDRRQLRPGQKRVLLPGAMSGRARRPPSFSASALAKLHTKNSRPRSGQWGRRRLLSLDEVETDPALLKVIGLTPDETIRARREGAAQGFSQGISLRIRRAPVRVAPGMTVTEFINAHKRRGRRGGKRRRKNKNGWTRLSGGWRMREIRSIDGVNEVGTAISGAMIREKRSAEDEDSINLPDEMTQPNQTEHRLTEGVPEQGVIGNVEQENQAEPQSDTIPPGPRVDIGARHRPRDRPHDQEHRHHNTEGERARQLAMYQLPMNDLTIKLNPFDPFEVDLFFQYILHKEGASGHYRPPHL